MKKLIILLSAFIVLIVCKADKSPDKQTAMWDGTYSITTTNNYAPGNGQTFVGFQSSGATFSRLYGYDRRVNSNSTTLVNIASLLGDAMTFADGNHRCPQNVYIADVTLSAGSIVLVK